MKPLIRARLLVSLGGLALSLCACPTPASRLASISNVSLKLAPISAACRANPWGIRVGAIRWDAWYGSPLTQNNVTTQVTRSLSPQKHWSKVPFFGDVTNGTLQPINGLSDANMDREIQYAARAGIDYWAFLDYPDGWGLETALKLYLSRPSSSTVKFALILNQWSYYQAIDQQKSRDWIAGKVAQLLDPRHEKVLGGRPLVYVLDDICSDENANKYCSPWLFEEITKQVQARKGVKPYYVYLTHATSTAGTYTTYLKLDAISAYAVNPGMLKLPALATPYAEFQYHVRVGFEDRMRDQALQSGKDVVPFATAGWDPTPRFECGDFCWGNIYSDQKIATAGNAKEIAYHVQTVAEWAGYHRQPQLGASRATSPAATMLIYAWNEFDEGGWLMPTLRPTTPGVPDTDRIDALQSTLRRGCQQAP